MMSEYIYAPNDQLENIDGEISSHTEDQTEVVEKVDTAGGVRPCSFTWRRGDYITL